MVKIDDAMVARGVKWCGEHVMMTRAGSDIVRGFLEAVVNPPDEPEIPVTEEQIIAGALVLYPSGIVPKWVEDVRGKIAKTYRAMRRLEPKIELRCQTCQGQAVRVEEGIPSRSTQAPHVHDWLLRGAGGGGGGPSTETYTCACGARKEVREWAAPRQRVITTTRTLYCRYVPHKHISDDKRTGTKDRRAHGHRGLITHDGPFRRHCVDNLPETWDRRRP